MTTKYPAALRQRLRDAFAVLLAVFTLAACGGGRDAALPDTTVPSRDSADVFVLEEADMLRVHRALAGEIPLDDGSTLSCTSLVEMYIQRIFAINDHPQPTGGRPVRGVLHINPHARDIAAELDEAYIRDGGVGNRPLHCMPILLKDNYDTFDHPSSSGSYAMLGHQAGVDADSVAGLREAGAVILGKANQDEFAFFTTGFSARAIQVSNPYNTAESPAGSSSGTGAAIAANFAIGGTGSDTCQSIRHPSSVNGLVGIRPSLGVISQHGIYPLSHGRDTGGPMTRSVRDAALMLDAMARVDERDAKTLEFPRDARPQSYTAYLDRDEHGVAGRNIGIARQIGSLQSPAGSGAQGELIAAAVEQLETMGATIYDVFLPDFQNRGAGSAHWDMNDYFRQFESEGGTSPRRCVSSTFATETNDRGSCLGMDGVLETLRVGPRSAALYAAVAAGDPDQEATDEEEEAIVDERDYVTGIMDRLLDADGESVIGPDGLPVRLDAIILSPGPTGGRTCDFGSTTRMGSIVVPVGFDDSVGVPRGMEIFVRRFDEGTGIGIAYDYEQATQHRRAPVLESSPLTAETTLAEFNARQQQALMTATSAAPEDLPVETYLQALEELVGP